MYFSVKKENGTFTLLDSYENDMIIGMTLEDMERLVRLLSKCIKQKNWKK
mgnify:CR=1 FL=1